MSFSADSYEQLPLLVCTNSSRDYRITIRRGQIGAEIDALVLKNILPMFAKKIEDARFQAAVGVMRIGSETDDLLAFRVFDVGLFRHRPHTAAIVGIIVPQRCKRTWTVSQALWRLPAPVPGDDRYEPPNRDSERTEQLPSPFRDLDEWEQTTDSLSVGYMTCFTAPPNVVPQTIAIHLDPRPTPEPMTALARTLIIVVLITIMAGIATIAFYLSRDDAAGGQSAPPPAEAFPDGREDDRLKKTLRVTGFISEFDCGRAKSVELRRYAVAASEYAQDSGLKLKERIERNSGDTVIVNNILKQFVSEGAEKAIGKVKALVEKSNRMPTPEESENAIKKLELWLDAVTEAKEAAESPDELRIKNLIDKLDDLAR